MSDKDAQLPVPTAETKEELPQLLTKLDQEFQQLKQNPTLDMSWISSDANTAIQFYLSNVSSADELTAAKVQLFGKSGRISVYLSEVGKLPQEVRPKIAAQINPVKELDLN